MSVTDIGMLVFGDDAGVNEVIGEHNKQDED